MHSLLRLTRNGLVLLELLHSLIVLTQSGRVFCRAVLCCAWCIVVARRAYSRNYCVSLHDVPAVPYVFGNTSGLPQGVDRPLALIMSQYWSSFATSGVPGGGFASTTLPPWPKYDGATDALMRFETPRPVVETHLRKAACDFFEGLL